MSLVKAATLLGYDKNSIQAYETGARLPDVQFLAHAAVLYKTDLRTMLGLLLRDQKVRGSNPPEPDTVCAAAANLIEVLDHEEILEPDTPYAVALNFDLLEDILHDVERAEKRTRHYLLPVHKARIVSALYGLALAKGPDYDLSIEYLMRVIRGKYQEYLVTKR